MEISLVRIRSYNSDFMANLAIAQLSQFGISAFIEHDMDMLVHPASMMHKDINVKVSEKDFPEADEILRKFEEDKKS